MTQANGRQQLIKINKVLLVALSLPIVILHCGMVYNTVPMISWWDSDSNLSYQNSMHPGLFSRCITYYMVSDMIFGGLMTPLIDIIGPRQLSLIGHAFMFVGWALLLAPVSCMYVAMPLALLSQGASIQLICNPAILIAQLFEMHSSLVVTLIGGFVEFSAFCPLLFNALEKRGYGLKPVVIFMMFAVATTATMVFLFYPSITISDHARDNQLDEALLPSELVARKSLKDVVLEAVHDPFYLTLMVTYAGAFTQFQTQTTFFRDSILLTSSDPSFLLSYFGFLAPFGAFTCMALGWVAQYWGEHVALHYIMGCSGVVSVLLWIGRTSSVFLATTLYFSYKSSLYSIFTAYVIKNFRSEVTGTYMSMPPLIAALAYFPISEFINWIVSIKSTVVLSDVWLSLSVVGLLMEFAVVKVILKGPGSFNLTPSTRLTANRPSCTGFASMDFNDDKKSIIV